MELQELLQRIQIAFFIVPQPSKDAIVCHACKECLELRDGVFGHTPDQLTDSWVEDNFDQLPLLSDDAKRYYLPAYLRVSACNPDSTVSQFVLFALKGDHRWEPFGGYSKEQRQAICEYLQFLESRTIDENYQKDIAAAKSLWQLNT